MNCLSYPRCGVTIFFHLWTFHIGIIYTLAAFLSLRSARKAQQKIQNTKHNKQCERAEWAALSSMLVNATPPDSIVAKQKHTERQTRIRIDRRTDRGTGDSGRTSAFWGRTLRQFWVAFVAFFLLTLQFCFRIHFYLLLTHNNAKNALPTVANAAYT